MNFTLNGSKSKLSEDIWKLSRTKRQRKHNSFRRDDALRAFLLVIQGRTPNEDWWGWSASSSDHVTACANMPVKNEFWVSGRQTAKEVFLSVTASESGPSDTTSANKTQSVLRSRATAV